MSEPSAPTKVAKRHRNLLIAVVLAAVALAAYVLSALRIIRHGLS